MRRGLNLDAPLIFGVVLAAAVFATAILAISVFAANEAARSPTPANVRQLGDGVEGASGFAVDTSTHAGSPVLGGWLDYLVEYQNLGTVTEPVQITDTLPLGTELDRAWWAEDDPQAGDDLPPAAPLPGGGFRWDLPDAGGGQERMFYLRVWLPPDAFPGSGVSSCVNIGAASDETTLEDNTDCTYDTVNDWGPNLAVASSHRWQNPGHGELEYELTLWNWGDEIITDPYITDTYPAGTSWPGSWDSDLPGVTTWFTTPTSVAWSLPDLEPGVRGRIWFTAALAQPAAPLELFTNTVEITTPSGDVVPADNAFTDVAVAPGEVGAVDLYVATDRSRVWVSTPLVDSSGWITVTTPVTTVTAHPSPDCRCWEFEDIGPVHPGDLITVTAGTGDYPVGIAVPVPFSAAADSELDSVTGSIDMLDAEQVEVALYNGPVRLVDTTMGGFIAFFPDVPRGAVGEVRYRTSVNYARVTFRRPFYTQDAVMSVHERDNWVDGFFEAGYPVVIEVRESDDVTVKGRAELETGYPPWWGGLSGYSTLVGDPWIGEPPDIVPGDWIHVWLDTVPASGQVRVGDITGTVEVATDSVFGTISAPWLTGTVEAWCELAHTDEVTIGFDVDPNGGAYFCDFGAAGWDLQPEDQVVVSYRDPESHLVANQFPESPPELGIDKLGLGAPTTGANFEYVVSLWNEGMTAATGTAITDTLPPDVSYVGNTSPYTVTLTRESLVFDVGTFEPGAWADFSLFVEVNAPVTTTITNTVEVGASNVFTSTAPEPSGWANQIQLNDTDLTLDTSRPDQDPEPGDDWEWVYEVCNVGATSSASVILTDTLPTLNPLLSWVVNEVGWTEVLVSPQQLVVERPTVSGGFCTTFEILTQVSPDAIPGQQLCNVVEVATGNDIDPANNELVECVTVGGAAPAVEIQKATNGEDADVPPGPSIPVGDPVEWIYTVFNTGNITLTAITVTDDQPGVVPSCPGDVLGPQTEMECTANGVATVGQYENVGMVTAEPVIGDPVSHADPSHYFGVSAEIDLEKATNGEDADPPPGPEIEVGTPVEWTYTVRNLGNVELTGVVVEDDQPGVEPDCPATVLAPAEEMVCTAAGVAVEGQYENLGTAAGQPPVGDPATDSDPSHYLGVLGLPFSDGFESGDTSAWSHTVP